MLRNLKYCCVHKVVGVNRQDQQVKIKRTFTDWCQYNYSQILRTKCSLIWDNTAPVVVCTFYVPTFPKAKALFNPCLFSFHYLVTPSLTQV